jgi:hypothetical protein
MKFKEGHTNRSTRRENEATTTVESERREEWWGWFTYGTSDGARWRSLACGRMAFEFWTLLLNYRRRRRPQSDVVVVATCNILNLQVFATCVKILWTYLSVAATFGSQSNGCTPRVKCLKCKQFSMEEAKSLTPSYPHVSHGDWILPRVGFLHALQK